MKFSIAALLLVGVCFAQTAPQAEVKKPLTPDEQAFWNRVNDFYTLLVKKQYRKAEEFVANDTKDYYYGIAKPDITKFEVMEVHLDADQERATALTQCAQRVNQPGFPMGEWNLKVPSLWKKENGQWQWYVIQTETMTPVGIVKKNDTGVSAAPAASAGNLPKDIPNTVDFALGRVGMDRKAVLLNQDKPEKITIINASQGEVTLFMPTQLGLDLKLEPARLNAGEKATLIIKATHESRPGTIYIQLIPTGELLPIQVEMK